MAFVTPVYKRKGKTDDLSNYRPISILPTIGKLLEFAVKEQVVHYLLANKLITDQQSAYLPGRSTQTSLHGIIDRWTASLDKGKVIANCSVDLAKGFDTIPHGILLKKLPLYGFSDTACKWFASYLSDRFQRVKLGHHISDPLPVKIGVPQGSVLGPILFIIYVNDLPFSVKHANVSMYADDSSIDCSGDTIIEAQTRLQSALNKASTWFAHNRLVVNTNKSSLMLISHFKNPLETLNISPNGESLDCIPSSQLLGLNIRNDLSWNDHITSIVRKLSPKLGLFFRLQKFLPKSILTTLYFTLIQPHIDYCIFIWVNSPQSHINVLQKIQNRIARLITKNYDYNIQGIQLVKQLGWMNINERYKYFVSVSMFKCHLGSAPSTLSTSFTKVSDIHKYSTRAASSASLALPQPRTEMLKRSLLYSGPLIWNALPTFLKQAPSVDAFKKLYKKEFFS